MRIHLLHVNDIHSQIENHCRIGSQLRTLRTVLESQGDIVLSFDLGDALDRVRPETEATYGRINAQILGAMELDGWVFGNNEGLTIPVEIWPELVAESKTTVFGTNIRRLDGTRFSFFSDWKVFECQNLKIGVFGITQNYDGPYGMLGIHVTDPFAAACLAVERLREQGCSLLVCLSHLGLWEDRKLAQRVQGIHVILGGHTHQFMEHAEYMNQTAIFQAGKHGLTFGHTMVDYDASVKTVLSVTSELINVNTHGRLDDRMLSAYFSHLSDVSATLQTVVAEVEEGLPVLFDAESHFANVLVDAMFSEYTCDLGIMMSGALTASLLPGKVRLEDVHAACPTPTRPIVMSLYGSDIGQIIEKGITQAYFHHRGIGYGFRGAVVGFLALANMEVRLIRSSEGVQIRSISIDGSPLDKERLYRVVTCEYLWLAPVFDEFKNGTQITFHKPLVRELLCAYLGNRKNIEYAHLQRYHIESIDPSSIVKEDSCNDTHV